MGLLVVVQKNPKQEARFDKWWERARQAAQGKDFLPFFLDGLETGEALVVPEGPMLEELLSFAGKLPGWGPLSEPVERPFCVRRLSAAEEAQVLEAEGAHESVPSFLSGMEESLGRPLAMPVEEAWRLAQGALFGETRAASRTRLLEDEAIQVLAVGNEEKIFRTWRKNLRNLPVDPEFFPELPQLRRTLEGLLEGGGFGLTLGAAAGLTQVMMQIPGWDAGEAQHKLPISFYPKKEEDTEKVGRALQAMLMKAWMQADEAREQADKELKRITKSAQGGRKKKRR